MSVISGEAYWAHVITPNTKFNPDGEWSIEVCNLDAKNKKIAEGDGLTIKNKDDDRGDFVTLKQYARTKDGSPRKISVKDSQRNQSTTRASFCTQLCLGMVFTTFFPKRFDHMFSKNVGNGTQKFPIL